MTRPRPLVNIRPAPDTRLVAAAHHMQELQQRETDSLARELARRTPRDTCSDTPPDDPPPAAA